MAGAAHRKLGAAAQWRAVGDWRRAGPVFHAAGVALVASLWWAIVLGIAWALLLGWGFGAWLYRLHAPRCTACPDAMRATSYFAGRLAGRLR
jgi:hypothetical protein